MKREAGGVGFEVTFCDETGSAKRPALDVDSTTGQGAASPASSAIGRT